MVLYTEFLDNNNNKDITLKKLVIANFWSIVSSFLRNNNI